MFATILLLAAASSPACASATAFVGTICAPAAPKKYPAVLLLGGSDGGDGMAHTARVVAQHGYVAASVAYFSSAGTDGLPSALQDIPVETVGKALAAVAGRSDVDPHRIAVLGISKGGEFALLAASTYPQFRAVVADVPSPFAWQGIPQGPSAAAESSWNVNGKPVPFVPYAPAMGDLFSQAYAENKPIDMRPGYDASMKANGASIPAAMFRLQNIRGPVLMLCAGDDRIWNSPAQCNMGMAYLRAHHHPYRDLSIDYPGAGHLFLMATPSDPRISQPMGPLTVLFGGTAQSNVAAANSAWLRIYSFLGEALGSGK